jgi:hypothetical protein
MHLKYAYILSFIVYEPISICIQKMPYSSGHE